MLAACDLDKAAPKLIPYANYGRAAQLVTTRTLPQPSVIGRIKGPFASFARERGGTEWRPTMFAKIWALVKDTVTGFLNDEALSRAAAIAYFTIFSIAPLLLVVIAIAGLVFGPDAARAAIMGQFTGLMGKGSGEALQSMLQSAGSQSNKAGAIATIIGVVTLLITASGAFSEIQTSLNKIWKAEPKTGLSRLVRARVASMGLVLTLGFLLLASLVISAGLAALGHWVEGIFPGAKALMAVANFVITLALLAAVFAAIYKFCRIPLFPGAMLQSARSRPR